MAKSFNTLLNTMPPSRRQQAEEHVQELCQKRQLTQQQLAERLNLQQAAVSKMENQSDMHISTLRRIVAAIGGELKLGAHFPDEEIVINQFLGSVKWHV